MMPHLVEKSFIHARFCAQFSLIVFEFMKKLPLVVVTWNRPEKLEAWFNSVGIPSPSQVRCPSLTIATRKVVVGARGPGGERQAPEIVGAAGAVAWGVNHAARVVPLRSEALKRGAEGG